MKIFTSEIFYRRKYPDHGITLARFLIWRFGEFGKDRQIKKLANMDYCMRAYGVKNSDRQIKSSPIPTDY